MLKFHEMPTDELSWLDIGEVNLECATGLHGSESIDVRQYVAVLDQWAEVVAAATKRAWGQFERHSAQFKHSEAYFRMLVLVTVLQRDLGVSYAVRTLGEPFDCTDSRLHFIHGIIEGVGGTCATLPVLFIAIGRRLGYPLKLVAAGQHLFVRWDDTETHERFNIEATATGLVTHSDEYYLEWPKAISLRHVRDGWLLKSMSPQEELAVFYETRGRCWLDWMEFRNAQELAYVAMQLSGGEANPFRSGFLAIVTVLHRGDTRKSAYGYEPNGRGIVLGGGFERPMMQWEEWAVRESEKELQRIEQLHVSRRRSNRSHVRDRRIKQLADQPYLAVEAYFEQEANL
jgi:hypothetical protein